MSTTDHDAPPQAPTAATVPADNEPTVHEPGASDSAGGGPDAQASAEAGQNSDRSDLEALAAERDKLRDQLLRTAADFDNYRKRSRKDVEDAARRGREDAIRELLPVADNLERAIGAAAAAGSDAGALVEGVRMVLRLMTDALERLGVTRVVAVGERFDPAVHEAIQQVESADHPPGTVIAELVPGYRYGDRLLRAAMVAVAKAPASPAGGPS